jgi:hypothetical protein
MAFDFEAAIKEASREAGQNFLGAIVLGSSGAGKSRLMGSFGCKTLYLYTTGEDHGPKSAKVAGGPDLVPLCLDFANGEQLSADAAYARLLEILGSKDQLKKMGIGAIAVDGATEIETLIRGTTAWERACQTAQGKHNTYAEPATTVSMFRPVISALKDLQRSLQIHFVVSCILDVKELGPNGDILEAAPRLQGYTVAEAVVQQFGDVLVIGRMERNGEVKYKLQFMTEIAKSAKDEAGRMKRSMNFSPRITGATEIPPFLDADLRKCIELKGGKK